MGRYPLLSCRSACGQSLRRRAFARRRSCDRWTARCRTREAPGREAAESNTRGLLDYPGRSGDPRSVRRDGRCRDGPRANRGWARLAYRRNRAAHYDRGARASRRCAGDCNAAQVAPCPASRFDGRSAHTGYRTARRRPGRAVRTTYCARAGLSKTGRSWLFALRLTPLSRQVRSAEARSGSCRIRSHHLQWSAGGDEPVLYGRGARRCTGRAAMRQPARSAASRGPGYRDRRVGLLSR